MNQFTQFLYKKGFLKFSDHKILKWKKRKEIKKLEFALQNGLYPIRKSALESLGELQSTSSIPLLVKSIDDEINIVSLAAIDALEKIGTTPEINSIIENKKEFWKNKPQNSIFKNQNEKKVSEKFSKWERPSKKNLDTVRQLLKKPINTGKWF